MFRIELPWTPRVPIRLLSASLGILHEDPSLNDPGKAPAAQSSLAERALILRKSATCAGVSMSGSLSRVSCIHSQLVSGASSKLSEGSEVGAAHVTSLMSINLLAEQDLGITSPAERVGDALPSLAISGLFAGFDAAHARLVDSRPARELCLADALMLPLADNSQHGFSPLSVMTS